MEIHQFRSLPLMGILRGVQDHEIAPIAETTASAGLKAIEITMNTADAPRLIRRLKDASNGRFSVGAGTVLTVDELNRARDAGAEFMVMPTLVADVMAVCVKERIPAFPGALTPQEIDNAWRAGATMVKVFPASVFGPTYFKDIAGPFPHIDLLACGGVNTENVGRFFDCGARGASFGGSIFKRAWIEAGAYDRVEAALSALISAYQIGRQENG